MKSIFYIQFRDEIKGHQEKVEELNQQDKNEFHGLTPKIDNELKKDLNKEIKMFDLENHFDPYELEFGENSSLGGASSFLRFDNQPETQAKEYIKIDGINYAFKHVSD